MATSYKVILKKDKVNAKGEMPLYLRIIAQRKSSFMALGIQLLPAQWDEERESVRKNHPNSKRLNHLIAHKLAEVQGKALELETSLAESVGSKVIKESFRKPTSPSFLEYFEGYLIWLDSNGRAGTLNKASAVFAKLRDYTEGKDISFAAVTGEFLQRYEHHLREKLGNSVNTIHSNLKVIRKLFNDAQQKELISPDKNPFSRFKLKTEKTQKTYLSEAELYRLEALDLPPARRLNYHRWMFVFATYVGGMRISDLLQLRWRNFDGGRLNLFIHKTKDHLSVWVPPRGLEILEFFRGADEPNPDQFIFPFLNHEVDYSDPIILHRAISSQTAYANANLKRLAELAEIDKDFSFHTSRHTFATRALSKGMRLEHVSKLMGHGSLKTTQIYGKIVNEDLDKAMQSTFGS